jgi:hypothetical protein
MFLKQFFSTHNNKILIEAKQASLFAKDIAGDFNPLHDPEAKRFCVPGDLLFSIVLEHYGLRQNMHFIFSGMVGHGVYLNFPETDSENYNITDDKGKTYLHVERKGPVVNDPELIKAFIQNYVAFSGLNFPHVLVPMMAKQNVMINTERPLVIYESMSFEFAHMNFSTLDMEASKTELEVVGKRGDARLHFNIKDGDEIVGQGFKKLIISGVREYDHDIITNFTDNYLARKQQYLAAVK